MGEVADLNDAIWPASFFSLPISPVFPSCTILPLYPRSLGNPILARFPKNSSQSRVSRADEMGVAKHLSASTMAVLVLFERDTSLKSPLDSFPFVLFKDDRGCVFPRVEGVIPGTIGSQ